LGYPVEHIQTDNAQLRVEHIEHKVIPVPNFTTKLRLLEYLLSAESSMTKVLVFAGTKKHADRIFQFLADSYDGDIAVVHGNKNTNHRQRSVDDFESGLCRVLVASDVLARGIDVTGVTHVVNFTIPSVPEDFVHRVGRTGRAERTGVAYSLVAPTEMEAMARIEETIGEELPIEALPEEVEVSNQLLPEEEQRPGMKIVQPRLPRDPLKGAAFHEKLEKNKKVPVKVSRADKMKLKYGKNYQSGHGGGTR
jgi:ATP-dependent RNA helicase RhlE